jgi:hypothetical protein
MERGGQWWTRKRYNTVTQEELKELVYGTKDTYMGNEEKRSQAEFA